MAKNCMDIAQRMPQKDRDTLMAKLEQYQASGMTPEQAQMAAANDLLDSILAEKSGATSKQDLTTQAGKFKVAQDLADFFIGGGSFKTIIEARKKIAEMTGQPIEAATEQAKQADEAIETAVVLAAREIIKAGRKQGRSPQVIYDRLVDLYNRQPNLGVRSSTSVRDQAYSTPVPLAFLASELAGITYESKVLEPTAGNGMLLIGADTGKAIANELNPNRSAMLDAMGFEARTDNAATTTLAKAKSQDAVIANPPFGATKDDDGATIYYNVRPDFQTREVDHAIAFKALDTMKDDGRAVLIVGGVQSENEDARREDYRGKNKRTFYFNLYNEYNVVDHFTVDGAMYSKQGASYPVDVIVIEGRGKAARALPAAELPAIIKSYEELKEKLNGNRSVESGRVSTGGTVGSESATRQGDGNAVDQSTGGSRNADGAEGIAQGNRASVPESGTAGNGRTERSGGVSGTGQLESADSPDAAAGNRVSGQRGRSKSAGSTGRNQANRSGDVGGSSRLDGQRVESGLSDRRGQEQETATQVAYEPKSGASSVGTLVPTAMRDSINNSLEKIANEVGDIDAYVAESLDMPMDTLRANFSAEQVDALALAIKNAENGSGFIIGDQTGIGKGRVVAAMIKYALVKGKVPIFVTEKPNLYADMIRDLDDIGMADELALESKSPRIIMTNTADPVPYTLLRNVNGEVVENKLVLKPLKSSTAGMEKLFKELSEAGNLGEYKVIFTTYSQLQTVAGKTTARQAFVQKFAEGGYMIFDESHNAGGAGNQQARTKEQREAEKKGDSLATGRAAFVRGLVGKANGTFFSSATYAKRPDVMDLYSSTNMKLAVDKISQLGEAIKQGGVPMQQAVATMLTQDGQYIRRERTFAGVSYDTVETKVDKQTAENMAGAMRSILAFSRAKDAVLKAMQKELDREGAVLREMGGEKTTVQGANFGSIMHNLIDQMLLALKAKSSVEHAIERMKAGEKVVLTVSNTMGSFLKEYADDMGLAPGDAVGLSFADLYMRYLDKQRMITIKHGKGQIEQHRLTDEELGPRLVAMFAQVREQILNSGFGAAPISPIDYIHNELRKAGFKTDEITGRTISLSYESGTPVLKTRNSDIKQRVKAVSGFNSGELDALILNQAGSTGLSLHASNKFKDQRKRHMIIVQAEKNIDTHMQMLGRVHRTGQVMAPAYSQMMADIPAEMRPAAVLMKKMASLNANTTASRKSSVTADGVVDFMNEYGGQVVQEYLRDNPDVLDAVGGSKVVSLLDDPTEADEESIRKFTGYIPILPISKQEEIYSDLIDRYNELIERENSLGTNKLEAKAVDLDAETVSSQPITDSRENADSVFASPAFMERVDVKRNVKPFSSAEVSKMVTERLGSKSATEIAREQIQDLRSRASAFESEQTKKLQAEEADAIRIDKMKMQLTSSLSHVTTVLQTYPIGSNISIKDKDGVALYGVVTDVINTGRTANPAAGSAWKMQVALANGDAKSITLSFSQLGAKYSLDVANLVDWYNPETQKVERTRLPDLFDKGTTVRREKRWIVTGNILAGFAKFPGQIITYTKKDGTTAQGVLMSRQFNFEDAQKAAPVRFRDADTAVEFMSGVRGAVVGTEDGTLKIGARGGRYEITVPSSKKDGGTYYLDKGLTNLTGDFFKRGAIMAASVYGDNDLASVIRYMQQDRQESIVALTNKEDARKVVEANAPMASARNLLDEYLRDDTVDWSRPRGMQSSEVRDALVAKFGEKGIASLESRGLLEIVQSVKDLPEELQRLGNGFEDGWYYPKLERAYIIADNSRPELVTKTLIHEIGEHYGLERMLGTKEYAAVLSRVRDLYRRGDKEVAKAWFRVELDYPQLKPGGATFLREVLAKIGESADGRKLSLWQRIVLAVKRWFGAEHGMINLSTKDLSDLVVHALHKSMDGMKPKAILRDEAQASIRSQGAQTTAATVLQDLDTFNWRDKSVHTQYDKAIKSPEFGKVFNLVSDQQNIISLSGVRAAEMAPGVLPKVDAVSVAAKTLLKGRSNDKEVTIAGNAVLAGTTAGDSVLDGRVFTEDEFMSRFATKGADMQLAWRLYNQTRNAINHSLDQTAAAEAFALAQRLMGRQRSAIREQLIDSPAKAEQIIGDLIGKQKTAAKAAWKKAAAEGNKELAASREADVKSIEQAEKKVREVFKRLADLKEAGYAPLMRFGKYQVVVRGEGMNEDGTPNTLVREHFETEQEAKLFAQQMRDRYPDATVKAEPVSTEEHKMFAGMSPETVALFADVVGAGHVRETLYREALSQRSALKRRLHRKNIEGYSRDMPRILAQFITSNARLTAQSYYNLDVMKALRDSRKAGGDVYDEASKLVSYVNNPDDNGAGLSSVMFATFLGGSVSAAMINMTQPVMMTLPFLSSKFGTAKSAAALTKALPQALGKRSLDGSLRAALQKASQEGVVEAQEIFHLYSIGSQSVAAALTRQLSRIPKVGTKVAGASEDVRARLQALGTLWGAMFAAAEKFNRKLTFIAAYNLARENGANDPFASAVDAVNQTQGIYNKSNRPNLARTSVGRLVFTFKQYSIAYVELARRMWRDGGPQGKRAVLLMLAILGLMAGEEGLPGMRAIDDLIDTIAQIAGYNMNTKKTKRDMAYDILGREFGDLFLYGLSSMTAIDVSGRLGLGSMIPATGFFKPSATARDRTQAIGELLGPGVAVGQQAVDVFDALASGEYLKSVEAAAPVAVKNAMKGADMAKTGEYSDYKGRHIADVGLSDAAFKGVGFQPNAVAKVQRDRYSVEQQKALRQEKETAIVEKMARANRLSSQGRTDEADTLRKQAMADMEAWNQKNPETPVRIDAQQIRSRVKQMNMTPEQRAVKSAPKEMRGFVRDAMTRQ